MIAAHRSALVSTPTTVKPASAYATAVGRPTYPSPTIPDPSAAIPDPLDESPPLAGQFPNGRIIRRAGRASARVASLPQYAPLECAIARRVLHRSRDVQPDRPVSRRSRDRDARAAPRGARSGPRTCQSPVIPGVTSSRAWAPWPKLSTSSWTSGRGPTSDMVPDQHVEQLGQLVQ